MAGYPQRPPMHMPPAMNYNYGPPVGNPGMRMPGGSLLPRPPLMQYGQPDPGPRMMSNTGPPPGMNKPPLLPDHALQPHKERPPVTTVFVGNISDRAPDAMIRSMLQKCGITLSWKRVQGASGKLQGFGFCEYEHPESSLRCVRLLNGWAVADKNLLVKVDKKTADLLAEYTKKTTGDTPQNEDSANKDEDKAGDKKKEGEDGEEKDEETLDPETEKQDKIVTSMLDSVMKDFSFELRKAPKPMRSNAGMDDFLFQGPPQPKRDQGLDDMAIGDDKKTLINREIDRFRLSHKEKEAEEERRAKEREEKAAAQEIKEKPTAAAGKEREERRERKEDNRSVAEYGGSNSLSRKREKDRDRDEPREDRREKRRHRSSSRTRDKDRGNRRDREDGRRDRERERGDRDRGDRDRGDRDRSDRERGDRERGDRERGERERGDRERGERERADRDREYRERTEDRGRIGIDRDREYRDRTEERGRSGVRDKGGNMPGRDSSPGLDISRDDSRSGTPVEIEDEEEALARRKLERKLREKEIAYQERLKQWEMRERKKLRDDEKEQSRLEMKKNEEIRDACRMSDYLEDYDDDKLDYKFYEGNAISRRLKEREKERDIDARDHQRERDEMDQLRRRLEEEGHPDPEGVIRRKMQPEYVAKESASAGSVPSETEEVPMEVAVESNSQFRPTLRPVGDPNNPESWGGSPTNGHDSSSRPPHRAISSGSPSQDGSPYASDDGSNSSRGTAAQSTGPTVNSSGGAKMGFRGIKLGSGGDSPSSTQPSVVTTAQNSSGVGTKRKRATMSVADAFAEDEEEEDGGRPKRKLVPLDYEGSQPGKPGGKSSGGSKTLSVDERRLAIKQLIERIPTDKEQLFAFHVDWSQVDHALLDSRIKPWVNKKIIEYIGEEEPTLVDFICQKVMLQSSPTAILHDVAMVLDDEAEVFVVKMWRLLIYEIESKKNNLVGVGK